MIQYKIKTISVNLKKKLSNKIFVTVKKLVPVCTYMWNAKS